MQSRRNFITVGDFKQSMQRQGILKFNSTTITIFGFKIVILKLVQLSSLNAFVFQTID